MLPAADQPNDAVIMRLFAGNGKFINPSFPGEWS